MLALNIIAMLIAFLALIKLANAGLGLIDDRVNYVGDIVAMVVADSPLRAEEAAALVRAEYDEEAAVTTFEMGLPNAFRPQVGGSVEFEPVSSRGDFEAAFADAPVRFEAEYVTPKMHQTPIETYATTALWEGDQLVLFDSTQYVASIQAGIAGALGVPPDYVRVVTNYIGGGFGAAGHHGGARRGRPRGAPRRRAQRAPRRRRHAVRRLADAGRRTERAGRAGGRHRAGPRRALVRRSCPR